MKRPTAGDVLRFSTPKGPAHLHYIGKHPDYGAAVIVDPLIGERPPARTFQHGYLTFYPVGSAVAQLLVEVVDHLDAPSMPSKFRRPGRRTGRCIDNWIIEDASGDHLRESLSDEEMKLPIASIWNHEALIMRVMEGWSPLNER